MPTNSPSVVRKTRRRPDSAPDASPAVKKGLSVPRTARKRDNTGIPNGSHALLRMVVETMDDGLLLVGADAKILMTNRRFGELVEGPPELFHTGLSISPVMRCLLGSDGVGNGNRRKVWKDIGRLRALAGITYVRHTQRGRCIAFRFTDLQEVGVTIVCSDLTEHHQHEKALKRVEQLREAMESQAIGFALYDAELRLVTCNSTFASVAPHMPELWQVGTPARVMLQGLAASGVMGNLTATEADQWIQTWMDYLWEPRGLLDGRLRDGRWLRLEARRTTEGNTVLMFTDLTELKQRENELAAAKAEVESEREVMRTVLDTMFDGVGMFESDGRVVFVNRAATEMHDLHKDSFRSAEDLLRYQLKRGDMGPVEDIEAEVKRRYAVAMSPGGGVHYRRTRQGRYLEISYVPVRNGAILTLHRDLTDLKGREEELAEARSRLTHAIETLTDAFALFDAEKRLVICNEAYRDMMAHMPCAVTPGQRLEDGLREFVGAGHAPHARGEEEALVQSMLDLHRRDRASVELRVRGDQWVRVFVRRTPDGDTVALFTDITELKQTEEKLARERDIAETARDEAEAANQAKSTFLATMSHEIRTPMNGVVGMIDVLERQQLDMTQRAIVGAMRGSAQSLLRIIDDVLDFSKIEAGRLELESTVFSLTGVIESVLSPFRPQISAKQLSLDLSVDPGSADALTGDPTRLRQILVNLLGNAVKFTERGGIGVRVATSLVEGGRVRVTLSVADTGIGLDEEQRVRLFQPFAQADSSTTRRFGGTGLGLSIVGRLAALMEGRVSVESTLGVGSTFTVVLTLDVAPIDAAFSSLPGPVLAPTAERKHIGQRLKSRVLVVDDQPVNREVLVRQLDLLGVDADTAIDGIEALAAWEASHYTVVLADIHMPRMDGYDLARRIRAAEAEGGSAAGRTPLVAVTANALRGEAERCFAAGMDAYLTKPVTVDRLRALLEQWLSIGEQHTSAGTSEQAGPAVTSAIDRSVLEAWLGNDSTAIESLLKRFRDTALEAEREIVDAVRSGDLVSVGVAAHRLKGAALAIGAGSVGEAAAALERASRANDGTLCQDGLWSLTTELRRALAEIPS